MPPSGRQFEIRYGEQRAVITESGATLRRYDVSGRPVIEGFTATAMADGGRGQILAPWPNRVADGRWQWEGKDLQLALSEAANRNAIHGLVRWATWRAEADWPAGDSPAEVTLTTTVWPQPGYPFLLRLAATYRLTDDGLAVTLRARNDGDGPAPYGVGQHPYLTVGTDLVDDVVLTVPATTRLLTDDRGNPVGEEAVAGSAYDFTVGRRIGAAQLDTAYRDLVPDPDGRTRIRLEGPDGHGAELSAGPATRWLQVFSGDTLAPARRRRGLAVEPMSCPPGALLSGTDLVVLEPGAEHELEWAVHSW